MNSLGEKIAFLVQEYTKNPHKFISHYKANYSFSTQLGGTNGDTDEYYVESFPDMVGGGIYMSTGIRYRNMTNSRWDWSSTSTDMILFAPLKRNGTDEDTNLYMEQAFIKDAKWKIDLLEPITEAELFQYSTILPNFAYESVEIFQYLHEHCTIPFKMNLRNIDIDKAIKIYGG